MGCLSSKEDAVDQARTNGSANAYNEALDGPPDFGLGDLYEVIRLLGEGGSGQTWLCRGQDTKLVAIKFIRRPIPKIVLPMLMYEIKIQAELGDGHCNLVSCQEVMLTKSHLAIVMEYASGGNLTAYVTDRWDTSEERDGLFLSEDEARYFFRQYINAVEYLHAHRVAHRDLKLDNIVLDGSKPPRIKVCDFGFAKNWDIEANMFTQIGTPVYMCPQLISSKNSKSGYNAIKADVWACGVLLFVMLLGMFPYDHTEHPDPNSSDAHVEVWLQQVKCRWKDCPNVAESAAKLSPDCQDMLDKMFERDEAKRVTVEEIKGHRWFQKPVPVNYQKMLDKLVQAQEKKDQLENGAAAFIKNSKRDMDLHALLERSGVAGDDSSISRIDLTKEAAASQRDMSEHARDLPTVNEASSPPSMLEEAHVRDRRMSEIKLRMLEIEEVEGQPPKPDVTAEALVKAGGTTKAMDGCIQKTVNGSTHKSTLVL